MIMLADTNQFKSLDPCIKFRLCPCHRYNECHCTLGKNQRRFRRDRCLCKITLSDLDQNAPGKSFTTNNLPCQYLKSLRSPMITRKVRGKIVRSLSQPSSRWVVIALSFFCYCVGIAPNSGTAAAIDFNGDNLAASNDRKYKKRKRRFIRAAGLDGIEYVAANDDGSVVELAPLSSDAFDSKVNGLSITENEELTTMADHRRLQETDQLVYTASEGDDFQRNEKMLLQSTNLDETSDEAFDYESYHAKYKIPLPILGTSMMGSMNLQRMSETNYGSPENFNADTNSDIPTDDDEDESIGQPRSFFQFAGTSAALQQYAVGSRDVSSSQSRRNLAATNDNKTTFLDSDETKKSSMETRASTVYETTLASIFKSRASYLWGEGEDDEIDLDTELGRNEKKGRTLNNISLMKIPPPSTEVASLKTFSFQNNPPPLRSDADLDRGRYLVGLQVREVKTHQQIVIDYEEEHRPIRIKYILSQNAVSNFETEVSYATVSPTNQYQILSELLSSSFARASEIWSKALKVLPVADNIVPTIDECGSAAVPSAHRENGLTDADILIYVSGDDSFCGGAVMHSAVCDFDQVRG